jgi:hypothetical protein
VHYIGKADLRPLKIDALLQRTQQQQRRETASIRMRLERQLGETHRRMDQAYTDKLDGKISEEYRQRKNADWQSEELRKRGRLRPAIRVKEQTHCWMRKGF